MIFLFLILKIFVFAYIIGVIIFCGLMINKKTRNEFKQNFKDIFQK